MIKEQTYQLRLLIEKVSIRERYFMLITLAATILIIAQGVLMITGLDNHDAILKRLDTSRKQIATVEKQLIDYKAALNNPRVLELRQRNDNLRNRINDIDKNIDQLNDRLMSPSRMVGLLKELLHRQSDLSLLQFKVLPVESIQSNIEGTSLFYQHGLEITLEGKYESLAAYLLEVEDQENQLFWDDLQVITDDFPQLVIRLKVHTLSRDEEWLNV